MALILLTVCVQAKQHDVPQLPEHTRGTLSRRCPQDLPDNMGSLDRVPHARPFDTGTTLTPHQSLPSTTTQACPTRPSVAKPSQCRRRSPSTDHDMVSLDLQQSMTVHLPDQQDGPPLPLLTRQPTQTRASQPTDSSRKRRRSSSARADVEQAQMVGPTQHTHTACAIADRMCAVRRATHRTLRGAPPQHRCLAPVVLVVLGVDQKQAASSGALYARLQPCRWRAGHAARSQASRKRAVKPYQERKTAASAPSRPTVRLGGVRRRRRRRRSRIRVAVALFFT